MIGFIVITRNAHVPAIQWVASLDPRVHKIKSDAVDSMNRQCTDHGEIHQVVEVEIAEV